MIDPLFEVLEISNCDEVAEVGGGHGQKGVDFQRCWAITRMIELEDSGASDFVLLFEAVQDVAVLDSATSPSSISIYQVKKKERTEWTWTDLTSLHQPGAKKAKPIKSIQNSTVGKLYRSVRAFKSLKSSGRFISNAGCNLILFDGSNAATSLPCALIKLSASHQTLLSKALQSFHKPGEAPPDLSLLSIERVAVPPDDALTYVIGVVHRFLEKRSPTHAGQARALVDALLGVISPLGGRTEKCGTFEEMLDRKGYSKSAFSKALGDLEGVLDIVRYLDPWYVQLTHEGMNFMDVTAIRAAVSGIYRRQVMGARSTEEDQVLAACDKWLDSKSLPTNLKAFFEEAHDDLANQFPSLRKHELLAHFALRAVLKCVVQT